MISPQQAMSLAQARRGELVELLSQLVAQRSHSGESARSAQQVVLDYLSTLPYEIDCSFDSPSTLSAHEEFMPPLPEGDGPFVNVLARPLRRRESHSALFAHIDTHERADGWSRDPYQPVIQGGRLYGLGVADGKGGVAAMLVAAAILHEASAPAPVVICCHGKGGGSRGSLPVFSRMRAQTPPLRAVAYAHPAETGRGLADIKHVVRGALDLSLHVRGWQGGPLEIGLPESALWSEGGDALQKCLAVLDHLESTVLRPYDVNVGRLHAGSSVGAVPHEATAELRVMFDDARPWPDLFEELQQSVSAYRSSSAPTKNDFHIELKLGAMRSNAGATEWEAPATRAVRDAIQEITQHAPQSYPNHYNGDIRFPLRLLGVPAFGIGSVAGNFYGPDEWVDIDDLVRLVAVLVLTVCKWDQAA